MASFTRSFDGAFVSPLDYADIDCACKRSTDRLVAACDGCGRVLKGDIHMPLIAHGFYCGNCCPCREVKLTAEERMVIRQRRIAARLAVGGKVVKEEMVIALAIAEEKREAFRRRMADVTRARWADPTARKKMVEGKRRCGRKKQR